MENRATLQNVGGLGGVRSPNRKPRHRGPVLKAMKASGIDPAEHQRVWSVEVKGLVPDWADRAAVRGLSRLPNRVWLWPHDAKKLIRAECRRGNEPAVTKAQVRRCKVCWHPFIGAEAERRRLADESCPGGRALPCGASCTRDAISRMWIKLDPGWRRMGMRMAR